MDLAPLKQRIDSKQRERRSLGIAIATVKKYSEDSSPALAASMAFWAFFSLFPLLLASVTTLGFLLPDSDRARVLNEVTNYLPLLEPEDVQSLTGSWFALIAGIATALWSGMAVVRITQQAFNAVWEVPAFARPNTIEQAKRGALTLATIGSVVITRYLSGAQATYGSFATVITMLWWFYLQAQITLLGMQLNVVLVRDYHPRGLVEGEPTDADRRLLQDYAAARRYDSDQRVRTTVPTA